MRRSLISLVVLLSAASALSQLLPPEGEVLRERRGLGLFGGGGGVHKGGGHFQQTAHHYKETYGFGPFHASFQHSAIKGHGTHHSAGLHHGPAHFHPGGYGGGHHGGGFGGLCLFS